MKALSEGRILARRGEVAAARQELERARDGCGQRQQSYVEQLEDEIRRKEDEIRRAEERAARESSVIQSQPIVEFVSWVSRRREAADRREAEVECAERGTPEHGWCVTRRQVAGHTFRTRYMATDSTVFRFEVALDQRLSCQDLGKHRMVRTWQAPSSDGGILHYAHCELTGKEFRGLSALVRTGAEWGEVFVFSRGFVDRDEAFRRLIERRGR